MTSAVEALTRELIARPSVTPEDAGCMDLLCKRLQPLGFHCERLRYGEVDNLWATLGEEGPLFVFLGHTDVVPPGPESAWHSPPFEPQVRDGLLYGRGAADMKGSVAAMVCALESLLKTQPELRGRIGLLLTSDEEGPAIHGVREVMQTLQARQERIQWCLVGEPSSQKQLGDVVRMGRRGSLGGILRVQGVQGHVAYPHKARNPIHQAMPALSELAATVWDEGGQGFPPTTFQISNIHAGTGATNVIPGELEVVFNFRFGVASSAESLQQRVVQTLDRHKLDYSLEWHLSGEPFVTTEGRLLEAVRASVQDVAGIEPDCNTGGGTSDGRFVAPTGAQVVELGPVNATIHQVNECVSVQDLQDLQQMYQKIVERLLCTHAS